MFEIDKKRIKICIEYEDYYSALEYAMLIKENYINIEKQYFEKIIYNIKQGNYQKIF